MGLPIASCLLSPGLVLGTLSSRGWSAPGPQRPGPALTAMELATR